MLLKRFLISVVLIIFSVLVIFSPPLIGSWTVILIVAVSLSEFYNLVEQKGIVIPKKFGLALGSLIPLVTYLTSALKFQPNSWEMVFTILLCFIIFVVRFTRKDSTHAIAVLSTTIFGLLYISWPLSFLIKLSFLDYGSRLISYLLLVTKIGDIGAYLVGRKFGRHTLIKRISPSKSKEGTVGGLFCSMAASLFVGVFWLKTGFWQCLFLGFLLGSLAQLGDLCESLLKRDCGVKDSGRIFPGLGGMLDLVDSIIFAAPLFYLYVGFFIK